jgi:hypothetical protein
MMGRRTHDQEQFFYSFRLDEAVPDDHPVREIAAVLDLSWVHSELAPYYPRLGRPSIDPVLMIRTHWPNATVFVNTHKATTAELKELWAKVANESLERSGDEGRAIREANAVVARQAKASPRD